MAATNGHNEGVGFDEAATVFEDPNRVEAFDEGHSENEARHFVIGFSRQGQFQS
jgi:uncharacterized DUF497 family protein